MKPLYRFAKQTRVLTIALTIANLAHAESAKPVPVAAASASQTATATPAAVPAVAPTAAAATLAPSTPAAAPDTATAAVETGAPAAAASSVSATPAATPLTTPSVAVSPATPTPAPVSAAASPAAPAVETPHTKGRYSLTWHPGKSKPVAPEKPRYPILQLFTFHVVANSVWNKDVGYDLFSENDVGPRWGIQLDADVLKLTPELVVAAELGYTYEASDDGHVPVGLGTGASIEAHHPHVAALLRWSLLSWLAVHARAQAGLSFTHLELQHFDAVSGSGALTSQTRNPFFTLGGGLSFGSEPMRISARREYVNSVSYGARLELGYLFSDAIALDFPDSAAKPPAQRLPVRGAALGSLDRSGVLLGVSAFVRF